MSTGLISGRSAIALLLLQQSDQMRVHEFPFDLVHFEARNIPDTLMILRTLQTYQQTQRSHQDAEAQADGHATGSISAPQRYRVPRISIEIEKDRDNIGCEVLVPFADVVFFGK